ncbi:DUF2382 domain-containing protein [Salinimicrobium terrae]|uniref:DUF2382 domain-containing protein n=1 Tax=Salinimicrobium terrae TaxID=470866 RepID=UPI000418FC7B|nr:DUF2382 domain-containing protein [Salinimicrobium terrae]
MEKRTRINHLEELNHSDYKIADDQPNIDNWKIVDRSDKKVGKVHDMLFDKDRMKVRYIITNLKDGEIMNDDRKVLIPIGQAQLNTSKERVIVPNIKKEHLTTLPKYDKADNLTQEDETLIVNTFTGTKGTTQYKKETFYDNENFNEDKFYDHEKNNKMENRTTDKKVDVVEENLEVGKKEVQTGGAKVTSRVVERPVEERVNLREENVEVKRNPVDKPADTSKMKNFEEKTIEAKETSEVPVVNKEARVKEEVTLEKEVKNKEEVIKDKVKETKVDVDKKSDNTKDRDGFASRKRSNTEKTDKNRF